MPRHRFTSSEVGTPKAQKKKRGFLGLELAARKSVAISTITATVVSLSVGGCMREANAAESTRVIPCKIDNAKNGVEAADACLHDRRIGKIALIGFDDITQDQMNIMARDASREIDQGTGGLVTPEIVPMLASHEALASLDDINKSCTYGDDDEKSAAAVAIRTMPLQDYPHVIAVNKRPGCMDGFQQGGVTLWDGGARIINMFGQKTFHDRNFEDPFMGETSSDVVAHELIHAYGMGHASTISGPTIPGTTEVVDGSFIANLQPNRGDIINLDDIFKGVTSNDTFHEYWGAANIMGIHNNHMRPLAIQRWQLTWPERLKDNAYNRRHVLNDGEARIKQPDSNDHDFAELKLDVPVVFKVMSPAYNEPSEQTYDRLVFDQYDDREGFVHLYLARSEDAATASIGMIDANSGATVVVGKQSVTLKNTPDNVVVYSKSEVATHNGVLAAEKVHGS